MDIKFIINHIRNREYMSGVEREQSRIRSTGEVFTCYELVKKYVDYCEQEYPDAFTNIEECFCDNSCGDGQFLGEILIRKVEQGIPFETALSTIYGVDYEQTNVDLCRDRLLCEREDLRHIVENNIVCADALTYDYSFNGTNMTEEEKLFGDLFE